MAFILCVLAVLSLAASDGAVTEPSSRACKSDYECGEGKCCSFAHLMVTKRKMVAGYRRIGYCEAYKQLGEFCGGGCGCSPELICNYDGASIARDVAGDALIAPLPGICALPADA